MEQPQPDLGHDPSTTHRRIPSAHTMAAVGLLVAPVLMATLYAFSSLREAEQERVEVVFDSQTRNVYNSLKEDFAINLEILRGVASLFAASDEVDRAEFELFVTPRLAEFRGIQALEWIPRVTDATRAAYERTARDDGFTDFTFRRWAADRDAWHASPGRWADEYFPVYFMQPHVGNEPAFGIDLASHPTRRAALQRARDTGRPVATARVTLAQETGTQAGFLVFAPVYDKFAPVATTAERRAHLRGFALSVYRVGNIVTSVLNDADLEHIRLQVVDTSSDQREDMLFDTHASYPYPVAAVLDRTFTYEVGGRDWQFRFGATPDFTAAHYGHHPWFALLGGIVVAALIGIVSNLVVGRADAVARLVDERTEELTEANQRLADAHSQLAESNGALVQSNMELQQFAYIASHDLQAPLRHVSGFAQLLKSKYSGRLDARADEWIGLTVEGVERMQKMIHDLLTFARVESRSHPFTTVRLGEAVDDALERLAASIKDTDAEITCGPLPTVTGDPSQMAQLFQNLIGNGIKYHGADPPRVHVSATTDEQGCVVSIRDQGIGIDPKHHSRIFEIFQRLHTLKEYPGTGIGLAVCRRIVARHGDTIWVDSGAGQGTTFSFSIPEGQPA